MENGFILTRNWRDADGGVELELWLATEGGARCLRVPRQEGVFFLPAASATDAAAALRGFQYRRKALALRDFRMRPVEGYYFASQRALRQARDRLEEAGLEPLEADINPVERFLMERFARGSIEFGAAGSLDSRLPGNDGDKSRWNGGKERGNGEVRVRGGEWQPELRVLSIDIETALSGVELYSIAAYGEWRGQAARRVFMRGDAEGGGNGSDGAGSGSGSASNGGGNGGKGVDGTGAGIGASNGSADDIWLQYFPDEKSVLAAFCDYLREYDPDVLIGWNVVNFDLWFLQQLADKLRVRLPIGREGRPLHWRNLDDDGERRAVQAPGRVVIDGIEMLRTATYRFESFALEAVSRELLGEGKLLHGDGRGEAIAELFQSDKRKLAEYNLRDCELVWRVFERTKLLEFAVARSRMTGLALDRVGGSVAAFDFLYLPRLHRAGFVAPNAAETQISSPGGFVLDSAPGIYDDVLVLDFKSLYPSIIRSFLIDPLGLALGMMREEPDAVPGFLGARFSRKVSILPDIIAELWALRDAAKARSDGAQSQAIKIIMNSFYGVLGTPGCRFFDPRLASSITRRGHQILQETRDRLEALGDKVIYGDTDSVFVRLDSLRGDVDAQSVRERGRYLESALNDWWAGRLREEFAVESKLELEFETHYRRFLMPTIRGSEKGSKKRYAGMAGDELVFKGLETVRTDWTPLAREFQSELYRRVFLSEPFADYIREIVAQLESGALDDKLIYRKRLRRKLPEYEKNVPPHAQAARRLMERAGKTVRRGDWVEYVMTSAGAEPVGCAQGQLDYHYYIERQLAPVADGILQFLDSSFAKISGKQISLF